MSKAERLIEASISRLARGNGRGALRDLGIDRTEVIRDAGVGTGVIYNHFGGRGRSNVVRGLADAVMDRLLQEQRRVAEDAAALYRTQAEALADGAGPSTIAKAILAQERQYGAVPDADDLTRARERAYYLAVALCDAATDGLQLPISPETDKLHADRRFRRHLVEARSGHRSALIEVCRGLLRGAKREPVHDVERLELVIRTLFEGAMLLQRVAAGHGRLAAPDSAMGEMALEGDALVDAILRVFVALSKPVGAGGSESDPESALFGRKRTSMPREGHEVAFYPDRPAMHAAVLEAIDQLSSQETLALCALHRSEVGRSRPDDGQVVKPAVMRFLADRGGQVRTLEKISSLPELDEKVDALSGQLAARYRITSRVLVMDSPPGLSPLLVGNRAAFLGREADGLMVDAVGFFADLGRRWCKALFDTLWHDERTYTLATPNGLNHRGIANVRRELEAHAPSNT